MVSCINLSSPCNFVFSKLLAQLPSGVGGTGSSMKGRLLDIKSRELFPTLILVCLCSITSGRNFSSYIFEIVTTNRTNCRYHLTKEVMVLHFWNRFCLIMTRERTMDYLCSFWTFIEPIRRRGAFILCKTGWEGVGDLPIHYNIPMGGCVQNLILYKKALFQLVVKSDLKGK